MRNEFAGTCYRCGGRVEPGQGHFEKWGYDHDKKWPDVHRMEKPRWLIQHAECAVKYRNTNRNYRFAPNA